MAHAHSGMVTMTRDRIIGNISSFPWMYNACINGGFYAAKRSKSRPVEGRRPGTHLMHWLAGGNDEDQSLANNSTACSAALAPTYADAL